MRQADKTNKKKMPDLKANKKKVVISSPICDTTAAETIRLDVDH